MSAPNTIWKYPLDVIDTQVILMPEGAEILSVAIQRDIPCVWVKVDQNAKLQPRDIHIRGTGHPLYGYEGKFIGSFQLDGGAFVFHVFEGR